MNKLFIIALLLVLTGCMSSPPVATQDPVKPVVVYKVMYVHDGDRDRSAYREVIDDPVFRDEVLDFEVDGPWMKNFWPTGSGY